MTTLQSSRLLAFFLASSAAMAITISAAVAQGANPEEMIAQADANGDGDISWDEVMALRAKSFDKLDRNDDGVISADDRPAGFFAARFDDAFKRVEANFDGDRDGQVTRDEMMGAPAPLFQKGDVNQDGVLTTEELTALRAEQTAL